MDSLIIEGLDLTDLNEKLHSIDISMEPADNRRLMELCGRFDEHLKQIENRMGVEIHNRGSQFQVMGHKAEAFLTRNLLNELYESTANDGTLTPAKVHVCLQSYSQQLKKKPKAKPKPTVPFKGPTIKTRNVTIQARTKNQAAYLEDIINNDISFGVGPAGTGKTYLAVACAVDALEHDRVKRIILVRPAVEAGERLGFLPGDLAQKIDPYLRPLYDALFEMMGDERVNKLLERGVIELAPLAYMRGRTLNDAFIILDESQNTTPEQMKMFLTRLGFGSTAVITGDITQIDLPRGQLSGLKQAIKVLEKSDKIQFNYFDSTDVVRHPMVQDIIDAYDRFDMGNKDQNEK